VRANPFGLELNVPLDHGMRVEVDEYCTLYGYPEIFVIGDMACFHDDDDNALPGVSSIAMQQGQYVAKVIRSEINGKGKRERFHFKNYGKMAVIGRFDAVAQMGSLELSGFFGWIVWLLVHIHFQVGFKNKVSILISWIWSFIMFKAGARLIPNAVHARKKQS